MSEPTDMGARRFGRVNWLGVQTLVWREVQRFMTVSSQTVLGPVATAVLFLVVFTLAFAERRDPGSDVAFQVFLAPGILMMAVIQNAFANTSSSLMIAKLQGNIVDTLMPPLSPLELLAGYVLGGVARGLVCAVAIMLATFPFVGILPAAPVWMLAFILQGSFMLAFLGLLAAIFAEKFDQTAAITNFVITPLSFLSGTFYSISVLPPTFEAISRANPFFYLIDGARYGALGVSDANPALGFEIVTAVNIALALLCWRWLSTGYRLKS
ncbi:MAG: ABC transporter permease [Pseudomonadota bacterium]